MATDQYKAERAPDSGNYYYIYLRDMMGCASVVSMSERFNIFPLFVGGEKSMYVIIAPHWMEMVTKWPCVRGYVCASAKVAAGSSLNK